MISVIFCLSWVGSFFKPTGFPRVFHLGAQLQVSFSVATGRGVISHLLFRTLTYAAMHRCFTRPCS